MRKLIALQMYIACAQGVVSPVAYLPKAVVTRGYKVIAEISRGWQTLAASAGEGSDLESLTLTVPFYHGGQWEISQRLFIPSETTVLYIEGLCGKVSVYQDKRLLWRGDTTILWVPLIGKGSAEVRLVGREGGILGGVYLLAKADTQAWQCAIYPDSLATCDTLTLSLPRSQSLSVEPLLRMRGQCLGYPFVPPARILSVLQKQHHALALVQDAPSLGRDHRVFPYLSSASYKVAFVLMWVALAGLGLLFPELRNTLWSSLYMPQASGVLENALTLVWLLAASALCISGSVLTLFWVFLLIEALLLEYMLGVGRWSWQSWLLLMGGLLTLRLLSPTYIWLGIGGAWGLRALRFILYFPRLAYLCSAEAFLGILFLSA